MNTDYSDETDTYKERGSHPYPLHKGGGPGILLQRYKKTTKKQTRGRFFSLTLIKGTI